DAYARQRVHVGLFVRDACRLGRYGAAESRRLAELLVARTECRIRPVRIRKVPHRRSGKLFQVVSIFPDLTRCLRGVERRKCGMRTRVPPTRGEWMPRKNPKLVLVKTVRLVEVGQRDPRTLQIAQDTRNAAVILMNPTIHGIKSPQLAAIITAGEDAPHGVDG